MAREAGPPSQEDPLKAKDTLVVVDLEDRPLGERRVPEEPQAEYYIGLRSPVLPGQRLKVLYKQAGTGFTWLYGYVHVR